jgi:hypothetical protein
MKKHAALTLATVAVAVWAVALLGLPGSPALAQDKPAAGVRWEYKITPDSLTQEEFNRLGGEGWEWAGHRGGGANSFVFKRPRR